MQRFLKLKLILPLMTMVLLFGASFAALAGNLIGAHAQPPTVTINPSFSAKNTSNPILLVHGITPQNCATFWKNTENFITGTHELDNQSVHWTGSLVRIGYYTDDTNCPAMITSEQSH